MKTIYKNGAVYTGKLPLVEAFAVEDGKFVFERLRLSITTVIRNTAPEAAQRQMPLQQPATKL